MDNVHSWSDFYNLGYIVVIALYKNATAWSWSFFKGDPTDGKLDGNCRSLSDTASTSAIDYALLFV